MSQAQRSHVQFPAQVLDMLKTRSINQKEAASKLLISDRQVRRLAIA